MDRMEEQNPKDEWAREPLRHSPWDLPLSGLIVGCAFPWAVGVVCSKFHCILVFEWVLYPGILLSQIALQVLGKQPAAIPIFFMPANSLIYGFVGLYVGVKLNRRRILRTSPGFCVKCSYNLTGLTERRCPECGTAF